MVDRLKTGRLNFDNTIKAYEDALAVRRVEEEETRRMTAEVYQAMTEEQKELTRLEGLANKERIMWDDELKMRRQLVEKRKEMIRWYEERTKSDMEAEALANGDMTREDEENMKKRKAVTALKLVGLRGVHHRRKPIPWTHNHLPPTSSSLSITTSSSCRKLWKPNFIPPEGKSKNMRMLFRRFASPQG